MIDCIKRTWRLLFRPKDRPEIARALSAIDAKRAAGNDLSRSLKQLSERL